LGQLPEFKSKKALEKFRKVLFRDMSRDIQSEPSLMLSIPSSEYLNSEIADRLYKDNISSMRTNDLPYLIDSSSEQTSSQTQSSKTELSEELPVEISVKTESLGSQSEESQSKSEESQSKSQSEESQSTSEQSQSTSEAVSSKYNISLSENQQIIAYATKIEIENNNVVSQDEAMLRVKGDDARLQVVNDGQLSLDSEFKISEAIKAVEEQDYNTFMEKIYKQSVSDKSTSVEKSESLNIPSVDSSKSTSVSKRSNEMIIHIYHEPTSTVEESQPKKEESQPKKEEAEPKKEEAEPKKEESQPKKEESQPKKEEAEPTLAKKISEVLSLRLFGE
jgi:hypothetical protein